MQSALFYEFSLEHHVADDHMVWGLDRFVHLSAIHAHRRPFYSDIGRCEEVHLNLPCR